MLKDILKLEGMQFFAPVGCSAAEREVGTQLTVNVELSLDLSVAGKTDDLAKTISYPNCIEQIKSIVENQPRNLLEAVAENIATGLLNSWNEINSVVVYVAKKPPLSTPIERFSVTLNRSRV